MAKLLSAVNGARVASMPMYLACLLHAGLGVAAPSSHSTSLGFYVALQSQGILDVAFDPTKAVDEALTVRSATPVGYRVGWLDVYGDHMYSISRFEFTSEDDTNGGVFAWDMPKKKQSSCAADELTAVNAQSSEGHGGVHLSVSPDGRLLAAASIRGSVGTVYPLRADGSIAPASFVHSFPPSAAQVAETNDTTVTASPHEAVFSASGRYLFYACRDSDRVTVFSVGGGHPAAITYLQDILLPGHTGPRHFVLHAVSASGRTYMMYLVNEVDNTMRVFRIEKPNNGGHGSGLLTVTALQTLSTLGQGLGRSLDDGENLGGEVQISADGRFLYASNRNTVSYDSDNIAVYAIGADHLLTWVGQSLTDGKIPRMFALSPDATSRWVAVANEVSQSLFVFERNTETGLLGDIVGNITFGSLDITQEQGPICILWKTR